MNPFTDLFFNVVRLMLLVALSCSVTSAQNVDETCVELELCGNGYCAPYCGECGSDTRLKCADCETPLGREMCFQQCDPQRVDIETEVCHICGDGIVWEDHEECDDRNHVDGDGCDSNCTSTGCGNGIITGSEQCDDGNLDNGDGCDSNCTSPRCGNGVSSLDENGLPEECDDGNEIDGDGCDTNCTVTRCGNGVISSSEDHPTEECDDGNDINTDACVQCELAECGDGFVQEGVEACDDGNENIADECAFCQLSTCGNGVVDPGEECDDGNDINTDECRTNCLEPCDAGGCICSVLSTINPTISTSLKIPPGDANAIDFKLNIPGLGKQVGTSFNFEYFAQGQAASCNTDCKANISGGIRGKWDAVLLTEQVDAEISGEIAVEEERCKLCDAETCQSSCGERSCLSQGGGASASLNYTRTIPLFPPKSFKWGPVRGRLGCEFAAGFGLGLAGSVSQREPGTAMECERCGECEVYSVTVSGNINGRLGCGLGLTAGRVNASGDISGSAMISPEFKYDYENGEECAQPGLCAHAKVSASANATGALCINLRFFNAKATCNVTYSGEAEAGCNGYSAEAKGPKYGCSVGLTLPGDCSQKCEKICRTGVPCGDTCQAASKSCSKPSGKACQGPPPELAE